MSYSSFGHLAMLLSECIILASDQKEKSSLVKQHVHNGRIMPEIALRALYDGLLVARHMAS
jgi:hypothetical protein